MHLSHIYANKMNKCYSIVIIVVIKRTHISTWWSGNRCPSRPWARCVVGGILAPRCHWFINWCSNIVFCLSTDVSNQSGAVGGIIWGPFPGSWTHLGASRGLRSQKRGPYLAIFGPSLTPPANPVKFFWSKMACTGVPHIVLHVSCHTRTSGGYFWPSEVRFRGILALSSDWFYNGHIENLG